jgi:hypothetical protein
VTVTPPGGGIRTVVGEALEIRAFAPNDIPWQEPAFWSDGRAVRDYLARPS